MELLQQITSAADYITSKIAYPPQIAVILGSGLGDLVNHITSVYSFSYDELPDFPKSTVEGHAGSLRFGYIGKQPVMAMQGRFHFYEGYDMKRPKELWIAFVAYDAKVTSLGSRKGRVE